MSSYHLACARSAGRYRERQQDAASFCRPPESSQRWPNAVSRLALPGSTPPSPTSLPLLKLNTQAHVRMREVDANISVGDAPRHTYGSMLRKFDSLSADSPSPKSYLPAGPLSTCDCFQQPRMCEISFAHPQCCDEDV